MRPWQFDLPSLAEMEQEDWIGKVRDWELFWARHKVWQNYVQHAARRGAKPRVAHEEWWGLHDLKSVEAVRAFDSFAWDAVHSHCLSTSLAEVMASEMEHAAAACM